MPYQVITTVQVPAERIANCFVGAFESGVCSWIHSVRLEEGSPVDEIAYACETMLDQSGWSFLIQYDAPSEREGTFTGKAYVGWSQVQAGLEVMAKDYPQHFADLIKENDDAVTHDVFMQCVILGEVVYG